MSALLYIVVLLVQRAWLSPSVAVLAGAGLVALGAVGIWLWRRPRVPTAVGAARLVDQRSGAKDHFLTLATVDQAKQPEALLERLRRQAEEHFERINLTRDFPFRFKHSAYGSVAGSLAAVILIHLLLSMGQPDSYLTDTPGRLRELAKQMAGRPELRGLAKELEAVAERLADPKVSADEKAAMVQQIEEQIQKQQKQEKENDNRDLLAQAASALNGEQTQQGASGQQQKDRQQGAGGIQTNAPQQGQGQGNENRGEGGEGKGESDARPGGDGKQGKSSQTNSKQRGQDKNLSGESKNDQNTDSDQKGNDPNKKTAAQNQGGVKEGAGKQQASDEPPPRGGPPAERFYKAGEGKDGLKGAGYVTVQLPEEIAADAKGESRASKDAKSGRTRAQVPVSNVPLPDHVPNAPTEKQPLPIEYRGIIR